MDKWNIGIAGWIIEDGNYHDFVRGQGAEFAVEFYPSTIQIVEKAVRGIEHLGDTQYRVCAEVVYIAKDWWAIDFGITAFQHRKPPADIFLGAFITADVFLNIDYYIYFEFLSKLPGVPALIYSWIVDRISMYLSRTVESRDISGRVVWITRDESELVAHSVEQTNAREDDDGNAWYVLHCTKLDLPPKHVSSIAIELPAAKQADVEHENHNP